MFNKTFAHKQTAIGLATVLALSSLPVSSAWAENSAITSTVPYAVEKTIAPENVSSGLEAYDADPLAQRIPLVLVHGIGGTESRYFHWENFLAFVDKHPEFKNRYKIYLYHYDSTRSVPAISRDLQSTLKGFIGVLGGRPIKILAYSEGGLLTRNALQDPYLDSHTQEVLTIATPFHGSPLANPEWLAKQVKTEPIFNPVRMAQKLVYQITRHKYPTFRQDFHWDNFDGAIPMDEYVKNNGPMRPQMDYALAHKAQFTTYGSYFGMQVDSATLYQELGLSKRPPKEHPMVTNLFKKNFLFSMIRNNIGKLPLAANKPMQALNDTILTVHGNIATTGATMGLTENLVEPVVSRDAALQAMAPKPVQQIVPPIAMPEDLAVPAIIESEDGSMELSAQAMTYREALSPTADTNTEMSVSTRDSMLRKSHTMASSTMLGSMMMYNDGISPISSTLWLGRYTRSGVAVSQSVDGLWATLKSLRGNRNTRLFAGLDHRNWMDGTTRTGQDTVQDLLNPDQKPRTIFEWIIDDLMT